MALARLPSAALALLAIAATGCGGGDGLSLGAVGGGEPNATDAAFVRAMVPHEDEAAAMAELGRDRALRRELRKIARAMASERRGDASELRELARGVDADPGAARMTRHPVDLRELRDAVSFDHRFMELTIRHLEEAVAMAEEEQDRGGDRRLKRMAGAILESHTRDLEALRRWLRTWYGEGALPGDGGGGSAPEGEPGEPHDDGGRPGEPPV
ncbi:MAG TPA: DUF305 domain-containing protein [Thermoleophilaceae bacterium]